MLFSRDEAFLIPFTLLWGGGAFAGWIHMIRSGVPWFAVLWGALFVAVGAYMIVGRFFAKRWRKRRTAYALTTHRALVAIGNGTIRETPVRTDPMEIRTARDGRHASVVFGSPTGWPRPGNYDNTGMELLGAFGWSPVGFYDVDDASGLLNALDRARAG